MLENETVWLSLNQISLFLDRDKSVISRHIRNIFKEEELFYSSTVASFATVQNESGRLVERLIEYYNLDVIISVGYRVKSNGNYGSGIIKTYLAKLLIQDIIFRYYRFATCMQSLKNQVTGI